MNRSRVFACLAMASTASDQVSEGGSLTIDRSAVGDATFDSTNGVQVTRTN